MSVKIRWINIFQDLLSKETEEWELDLSAKLESGFQIWVQCIGTNCDS